MTWRYFRPRPNILPKKKHVLNHIQFGGGQTVDQTHRPEIITKLKVKTALACMRFNLDDHQMFFFGKFFLHLLFIYLFSLSFWVVSFDSIGTGFRLGWISQSRWLPYKAFSPRIISYFGVKIIEIEFWSPFSIRINKASVGGDLLNT